MHAYVACSIFQLLSTRYSQCSTIDVSPGSVASGQLISAVMRYEAIRHLQPDISRRPELATLVSIISFLVLYSLAKGMLSVRSMLPVAGDADVVQPDRRQAK